MNRVIFVGVGIAGVLAVGSSAMALPPGYTVTDLGDLGGSKSEAYAVNDDGTVVGRSTLSGSSDWRAFLWTESQGMAELDPSQGRGCAHDVNNLDQVVGYFGDRGFVWENGTTTLIEPFRPTGTSRAYGINDQEHVVGYASATEINDYGEPVSTPHVFLRRDGVMTDLGLFDAGEPGETGVATCAINEDDTVLAVLDLPAGGGVQASYVWNEGEPAVSLAYGDITNAPDINDDGHVCGFYMHPDTGEYVPFVWEGGGKTDLPRLAGDDAATVGAIDEGGTVVGYSRGHSEERAVVWEDGTVTDLNSLIPPDSGWALELANDINEGGQIVGWGRYGGDSRAFLLTPVPEPATLALLVLGGLGVLVRRKDCESGSTTL